MLRRFADLAVDSDVAFDDLPPADGPARIIIRRGAISDEPRDPVQSWPAGDGTVWLAIERGASAYHVTLPGLRCAVEADGSRIVFDPAADLSGAALVHLLLHQVLPLAVSRTGRIVLHACAVETPAGAIAFLGQSGSGKSTLAAAFCRRGSALVADDALVVEMVGEAAFVWPSADAVRLWDDMQAVAPGAVRSDVDLRSKLRAPVAIARGRAPLARVYLLDTREDGRVSIDPVSASDVRIELLSHVFRLDIHDAGESRRLFDAAHRIAARVPSRTINYPNGLRFLDAVVDAVTADLA